MFTIQNLSFDGNRLILHLFFSLCLIAGLTLTVHAATFTVTTTADNGDNANPIAGSLRAAILSANSAPGADTIAFSIGSGPQTIQPSSALPQITGTVIIDGTTQPGFAGSPIIEIDGTSAGANATGIRIAADHCTVRGLVINRFSTSFGIEVSGTGNNVIVGNFIGTDLTGTIARANFTGLALHSANNVVGGTSPADRNIISGNNFNSGVAVGGQSSTGNVIQGNYIGTDVTGSFPIGNGSGLYLVQG